MSIFNIISVLTSALRGSNIYQIFTQYLPNIQTTVGGNDPDLELRGQGRAGQPGPDDQHHGQHRVGRPRPVLDQHEVG